MGNCVTVYKNKDPSAAAPMNLSAKIESPTKENIVRMEKSVAELDSRPQVSSVEQETSFRDAISWNEQFRIGVEAMRMNCKTEDFFDSQPWLESDCEDYFSVNGDSTSSCGNSPTHQKSFRENPEKVNSMDRAQSAVPEHSPTETKKQLIELFRESFNDDTVNNQLSLKGQLELEDKTTNLNLPPKSTGRSPYESMPNSVHSSEATPYNKGYSKKEKSTESAQCCLPSLVRNLSFGERRKRLSPAKTG
ncbi:hypothetical protein COLO4_20357 [Corchorus olitorius]|uniref:Uncharacterized protein n=1 Tax=Corchorus olitorius TaxID=93759 RepID=A0A1R3J058_9ROSI|nr:hypothetical protein COLO4_20357 [Corchorus olitorius]